MIVKVAPLKGLRILNTRSGPPGQLLQQQIRALGGQSIDFPTLNITPTPTTWLKHLPPLNQVQGAIFVSQNAVKYFFTTLDRHQISWIQSIHTVSIGEATAKKLQQWHIDSESPSIADSEHLLTLPTLQTVDKNTLLLVKGIGGRPDIADTLLKRGANVLVLEVYQRSLPQVEPDIVKTLWQEDLVDVILITSVQSLHHLIALLQDNGHRWLCHKPCLVISERIATEARNLGINQLIVCPYYEILPTLGHYVQNKKE